jgi:Mg2+/Co2+ transporter CorB
MSDSLFWSIGLVILFTLISAFFSIAETGLTSVSRARLHSLARDGNRRAKIAERIREEQKEAMIGTILLGNNLVNVAASAVATSAAIAIAGQEGIVYVTILMTVLIVIVSELTPKTYAIRNPEKVSLALAPIFQWLIRIFWPITRLMEWTVSGLFRLVGIREDAGKALVSAADAIRGAIDLQHMEGGVVKQERDMLGSILDLGDLEVGEIMTHRKQMLTLDIGLPAETIIQKVLDAPYTRIPLWQENPDNIVGVLHAKNLVNALRSHPTVAALDMRAIASEPWFIPESTSLYDQLHAFRERRQHFALVVDEYGTLEGLVTLEDILEEIVGQIDDEHDRTLPGIRVQKDGSVIVDGTITIRDLNREMDWHLPDANANTVAGLVIYEAREVPEAKQAYEFLGFRFKVLQRQKHQITRLKVSPMHVPETKGEG